MTRTVQGSSRSREEYYSDLVMHHLLFTPLQDYRNSEADSTQKWDSSNLEMQLQSSGYSKRRHANDAHRRRTCILKKN